MAKLGVGIGIASALVPLFFVVWSHTASADDFMNDTYVPHGPTREWSDFTPSNRTQPIREFEGFSVRPVIAGPVYILFQPRRHAKNIRVEVVAHANALEIGGRAGMGPDSNFFVSTEKNVIDGVWTAWTARIPFDRMISERTDARRIVLNVDGTALIRSVRIVYED